MSIPEISLAMLVVLSLPAMVCAEEIKYGVGEWPEKLGNHRAVVRVSEKGDVALARVEWRRHDANPKNKAVWVYDAATGKQITNVAVVEMNREFGNVLFQPQTAPGDYYVYYMPFSHVGEAYQGKVVYETPKDTADSAWLAGARARLGELPKAALVEMQSRGEWHRFDPMEVIATEQEVADLLKANPLKSFLLFPEDRRYPVKMTDYLPRRWAVAGPQAEFHGEAQRGEFYTFQIGVYAARCAIEDLTVNCSDFTASSGASIKAADARCFNLFGADWAGRPIKKVFSVGAMKVRPLWLGIQIPQAIPAGEYTGMVFVKPEGAREASIKVTIKVSDTVLADKGDGDLWRMSRLRWLDSGIGLDDTVTKPYMPIKGTGATLQMLGRSVRFGGFGLPESIVSNGREILAGPIAMTLETDSANTRLGGKNPSVLKESGAEVARACSGGAGLLAGTSTWKLDYDGYIDYRISLTAKSAGEVKDIRLEIPIRKDVAAYMMGLGRKGGYRPDEWKWTWDKARANNTVWIGDYNAGLYCKLKIETDPWDIATLSALPKAWHNDGKGGCEVVEQGDQVIIRAYSGPRKLAAGERLDFCFGLLITPVKPLDPDHWKQRHYHFYKDVPKIDDIAKTGASIVNIHQGNDLNPYINYPFVTANKLKTYVDEAHSKGLKAKIYYTVRELSNRVAELWALRSLGDEVFLDGAGGGDSWLVEHLGSSYVPAWHDPLPDGEIDAAMHTTGLSRWHNYYLEGLSWLIKNVGIDGLYLDGIGYDRQIMKRVRRMMEQSRPSLAGGDMGECLIDFHSGNEFPFNDMRISPACKYMEHFPYIDSLWFGEGYDYDETPDYWLVEISGIPFGLYGEMLQGGGNPWRGMLYGMTNRLGWGGDPKAIWKVWDDFGIGDSKTIGYWDPACPVKTDNKDVLATAYVKPGKTLISLASWAKEPARVKLTLDWDALGIDIRKARLRAPAVPGFQDAADFQWSGEIPVEPGKGWLIIVEEKA
jgi:hypothetical protein